MADFQTGKAGWVFQFVVITSFVFGVISMNISSRAKVSEKAFNNSYHFKNASTENNSINLNEKDVIETSCHVMTEELTAIAKVSVSSALENLCNSSHVINRITEIENNIKGDINSLRKILYDIIQKLLNLEEKANKL